MLNRQTRILLIDESPSSKDEIKPKLDELGHLVIYIQSIEELNAHLQTFPPPYDVILVESVLPQFESDVPKPIGKKIAIDLKKKFPLAKIIIFTSDDNTIVDGTEGVFECLSKSLTNDDLVKEINRIAYEAKHQLAENERRTLRLVSTIALALLDGDDLQTILDTVVQGIAELGFKRVRLSLVDPDGKHLIGVSEVGMKDTGKFKDTRWLIADIDYDLEQQNDPQVKLYQRRYPDEILPYERTAGKKSVDEWVTVPLVVDDKLVGKISADTLDTRRITESELDPLMMIANQAAIVVSRHKLRQREIEQIEYLRLLDKTTVAMTSIVNHSDLLRGIVECAVQLIGGTGGGICVYYPNIERYQIIEDIRRVPKEDLLLPLSKGMAGHLIQHQLPYLITPDYTKEPYKTDAFKKPEPFKAMLQVLLYWHDEIIGVLYVDHKSSQKFSNSDANRLIAFAAHAANALNMSNLLEEKNRLLKNLESLFETSGEFSRLNQEVDKTIDESIFEILRKLQEIALAQEVLFVKMEDNRATKGIGTNLEKHGRNFSPNWVRPNGTTVKVFKERQILIIEDTKQSGETLNDKLEELNVRSAIGFPAMAGDECIGVVWLDYEEPRSFDEPEIKAWQLFVNQVATFYDLHSTIDKLDAERHLTQMASEMVALKDLNAFQKIVAEARSIAEAHLVSLYMFGTDGKCSLHVCPVEDVANKSIVHLNNMQSIMHKLQSFNGKSVDYCPNEECTTEESDLSAFLTQTEIENLLFNVHCHAVLIPLTHHTEFLGLLVVEIDDLVTKSQREALKRLARIATVSIRNAQLYETLRNMRQKAEGATALASMHLISTAWHHANKGRAITIRDCVELLRNDYREQAFNEFDENLDTIASVANKIITPPFSMVTDLEAAQLSDINRFLTEYIVNKQQRRFKNIKIQWNGSKSEAMVRVQHEWIRILFDILFDNAIYSMKGNKAPPQISIYSDVNQTEKRLSLRIKDNGVGFPDEIIDRIFVRPIPKKAGESGSGVGLLMARLIVETYDGTIEGKNSIGINGAEIHIQFPLE